MQDPVHAQYLRRAMRQQSRSQKLWMFPVGLGIWVYALLAPVVGDVTLGGDLGHAVTPGSAVQRGAHKAGCRELPVPVEREPARSSFERDEVAEPPSDGDARSTETAAGLSDVDMSSASMPNQPACMRGCA